ncbi:MAG TPA: xanthine dehydrogenase family protein molybdopterin-binding subunit [Bryobacteraceae bacterium]|nr:xanthine dehydrogenase family protein molybdopterin-binding subunit [Bryobacteraceae bacterium]
MKSQPTETGSITIVSRRGFLGGIFSAGALVLGATIVPETLTKQALADETSDATWQPSVYLGLEPDGRVIIVAHRSEMGTGIRTALPMVVADELEADWKRVKVEQALGNPKYGSQDTDGSESVRHFFDPMRVAGATARAMLESAAASQWGVPASECQAKNHEVVHSKSGRKLGFGELVTLAAQQPVPKKAQLRFKTPAEYRYIGKNVPIVDLDAILEGQATFGMDARMPGMVYASIEHPPVFGGKLKNYDDAEARKVRGVSQTLTVPPFQPPYGFQPLGGVAVIADNTWAAMQGRRKLKVDWDLGPNVSLDSAAYKKTLQETARKPCKVARNDGDVDATFKTATKTHEAEYYVPHLAHASMEPPVAVAEFKNGKVETWTCTQNPQAVQDTVAKAVGIKPEDVTCHVTLLGGGFGRKSKPDYVAEAAVLSKQLGKPVKVVWTREDDIRFDFYHAVAAMYVKAAVDEKGRPTAWLQRSVFPPIESQDDVNAKYGMGELDMGWTDVPYDIPNFRAECGPADTHIRIGWMRSVANIPHAFAVQSFTDELAAAAGRDRVEYLLDVLGQPRQVDMRPARRRKGPDPYMLDIGRMRHVVEIVAEQSGWAKKKAGHGRALGIAVHRSFLTYVATVVEVEVDNKGKIHIPRVDVALDTGRVVHPDRVRAQLEGASVFGASIALMGEITAANGRVQQSNFNNYLVARLNEAPVETHVHIVPSMAPPAGVGEPGVPPMSPAICNAIFAATGKRIRELPIKNQLA